jgi:hypothetical protein
MPTPSATTNRIRHRLVIEVPAHVYRELQTKAADVTAQAGRFVSLKSVAAAAVIRAYGGRR